MYYHRKTELTGKALDEKKCYNLKNVNLILGINFDSK